MKNLPRLLIAFSCFFPSFGQAQSLFDSKEIFEIKLTGAIREALEDRVVESNYHSVDLAYRDTNDAEINIPIKVKTRGHFRKLKENCTFPPLLLNFSEDLTRNTIFSAQKKLKLVTPCRSEKYVVREYLVYQLYNLVTLKSFKARLVKVHYGEPENEKESVPLFGILLEEEEQMAARNQSVIVDGKLVRPEQTNINDFLTAAVFEYMIGNTDWSVQYLQNIKLIAADSLSTPTAVPYDFDHSGLVSAPYAQPAAALELTSIRERRYRGYCVKDMKQFDAVIAHFNAIKDDAYALYAQNELLEESYIKSTLKYFDEFYKIINNPKQVAREFQYPCLKTGTGNVVIKGLKQ